MHPLGASRPVLVGLDLHHRRLRRALETRNAPGVRIRLLELVRGPVDHELAKLLGRAADLEVLRKRRSVVIGGEVEERCADCLRRTGRRLDRRGQHDLERALEPRAEPEYLGIPLEAVVDLRERAVVELVRRVERELEVLVAGSVGAADRDRTLASGQVREERLAGRPAGAGKVWGMPEHRPPDYPAATPASRRRRRSLASWCARVPDPRRARGRPGPGARCTGR